MDGFCFLAGKDGLDSKGCAEVVSALNFFAFYPELETTKYILRYYVFRSYSNRYVFYEHYFDTLVANSRTVRTLSAPRLCDLV